MSTATHVAVIGAGPAGLGAAYQLAKRRLAQVTVLERGDVPGGLAGSFELSGLHVDYGSHRLHPACAPAILADLQELLGKDLLDRPRHGRIRLRGRWIHFPLKPLDLVASLPPGFALSTFWDMIKKPLPFSRNGASRESFASVLKHGLGSTICRDFYFPYARKIWGAAPEELSAIQARKRVKAGSLGKLFRKVFAAVPGFKPPGTGRFYYPRRGYGQLSEQLYKTASGLGAGFIFGATVESIEQGSAGRCMVHYRLGDSCQTVEASHVWSTIPVTVLTRLLQPAAPANVQEAAKSIHYRSMILIYLVVGVPRFTEYDAHYFPEIEVPITRMSEPRNYSLAPEPSDRTVLCAELPCAKGDDHWNMSDAELGRMVADALAKLGIPLNGPVLEVVTRRMPQAYPIYYQGYQNHLQRVDGYLSTQPNLLSFGRQGLFAHDNTHHALAMAYAAVDCLDSNGRFDSVKWKVYRQAFETHVVED